MENKAGGDNADICVAVATHKAYRMPTDSIYLPLHVGKALHPDLDLGFTTDDTGDNISAKNSWYSELTGLYWVWKNVDTPYKGLVHYRRHFATPNRLRRLTSRDRFDRIVSGAELRKMFHEHDIILPKRRNYYIETIYSHYAHTFDAKQLEAMHEILKVDDPEYVSAFDFVMSSRGAHMFNMFIMTTTRFDEYCSWLFPLLEKLNRQIVSDRYDAFEARYLGRVSEMLLDVWLFTNGYKFLELPIVSPEHVNWLKKGTAFLRAKSGKAKYHMSF